MTHRIKTIILYLPYIRSFQYKTACAAINIVQIFLFPLKNNKKIMLHKFYIAFMIIFDILNFFKVSNILHVEIGLVNKL